LTADIRHAVAIADPTKCEADWTAIAVINMLLVDTGYEVE
jgi:hypothetical protein